jgi:hypothetical protein
MKEGMSNGCWMERVIEEASEFGLDREAMGYVSRRHLRLVANFSFLVDISVGS